MADGAGVVDRLEGSAGDGDADQTGLAQITWSWSATPHGSRV